MGLISTRSIIVSAVLLFGGHIHASAYEETGAVSNGGTISGQVFFRGTIPTTKISPNKDLDVCGGPREDALIDVGPGQGVAYAIAYLTDVSKGKAWPDPGKKPTLNNLKCRFDPPVQVIRSGSIDVVNKDPVLHNTHGYYGKRTAFNVALPNQGQSVSADLQRGGTVKVDCDAHGWMEGWIYVRDNPYYALTSADGKFKITDVPPGAYTLVIEQPYTALVQQPVTVAAGGTVDQTIELKLK